MGVVVSNSEGLTLPSRKGAPVTGKGGAKSFYRHFITQAGANLQFLPPCIVYPLRQAVLETGSPTDSGVSRLSYCFLRILFLQQGHTITRTK